MKATQPVIDLESAVFVLGDAYSCYVFNRDRRVVEIKSDLDLLYQKLEYNDFIKINPSTFINTKYFISKFPKREIILKDGSIHKVSRQKWKEF